MKKCELCKKQFKTLRGLSSHINQTHTISIQDYYNKYVNSNSKNKYCKICEKINTFNSLNKGYTQTYCSCKCRNLDKQFQDKIKKNINYQDVQNKIKQTCLNRYGVQNVNQLQSIKDKIKQTNLQRYGVQNPLQSQFIKDKMKKTNLQRRGCQYPTQSQFIKDKIKQTNLQRYGGTGFDSQITTNKFKQTMMQTYGVQHPMYSQIIKDKVKQTNLQRYGGILMGSKILRQKIENTNLQRYGNKTPFKCKKILNKIKETNLQRYGYQNPFYNPQVQLKIAKQFGLKKYKTKFGNTVHYQSRPQLSYIKQCQQKNIKIFDGDVIEYSHNGKKHNYIVDFKIKQSNKFRLIEIKANHHWFKQQKQSGVFKNKVISAQRYSINNNYLKYKVIMYD